LTIGTGTAGTTQAADFSLTATPTTQETDRGGPFVTFTITSAAVGTDSVVIKLKTLHVRSALVVHLGQKTITAGETFTVNVRAHRDAPRKTYQFILKGSSNR